MLYKFHFDFIVYNICRNGINYRIVLFYITRHSCKLNFYCVFIKFQIVQISKINKFKMVL